MDSKANSIYKGSNCNDSVDAEHVHELLNEHYAGICKDSNNSQISLGHIACRCKIPKPEAPQMSRKTRSKTVDNRKILLEMLIRSELILLKVLQLEEESRQVQQDVSDDIQAPPS